MSIFFVILRGKNDATLTWPFNYSVTFSLLGQTETKLTDDIAVTFTPNPISSNAAFLGMPTSERNQMLGMSVRLMFTRQIAHSFTRSFVRSVTNSLTH